MRYPRGVSLGVQMDAEPVRLADRQGEVLKEGTDVAIVAIGVTVWGNVSKRPVRLELEGISTAVVNGRFVKPLDAALIGEMAKKVRYLVTIEEGTRMGGFGSAVLEAVSDLGMADLHTKVLGLPDWYLAEPGSS